MINFIRKAGGTVSAYDDALILDMSTHGKNGIIAGIGDEMESTAGTFVAGQAELLVGSGQAILKGRQFEITDLTSESILLTAPISDGVTYYYNIYIKIDLRNSIAETLTLEASAYSTTDYPTPPASDDLITTKNGLAYFTLCKLTVTNAGIQTITQVLGNLTAGDIYEETQSELDLEYSSELLTKKDTDIVITQKEIIDDTPFVYNTSDATMTITLPTGKTIANGDRIQIEFYLPCVSDSDSRNVSYGIADFKIRTNITDAVCQEEKIVNGHVYSGSASTVDFFNAYMPIDIYSDKIIVYRARRTELYINGTTITSSAGANLNVVNGVTIYRIIRIID